ncbi:MAG: DNA polymerase III subunit chi [Thermodesulfobacteriota bacterium]
MARVVVEYVNLKEAKAGLAQAAGRLAAVHLAQGRRVLILARDQAQAQELDLGLWTYEPDSFLPHALAGGPDQDQEPVLIATEAANPNQATVLIAAKGLEQMPAGGFAYLIQLLPPEEGPELSACRACYKALKDAGRVQLRHSTRLP